PGARPPRGGLRTPRGRPDGTVPLKPMLAVAGDLPAEDGTWSYEMKWDGVRVMAAVSPEGVRLTGRSGADMTVAYPELAGLADAVGTARPLLDGEVVVLGPDGRTDF